MTIYEVGWRCVNAVALSDVLKANQRHAARLRTRRDAAPLKSFGSLPAASNASFIAWVTRSGARCPINFRNARLSRSLREVFSRFASNFASSNVSFGIETATFIQLL